MAYLDQTTPEFPVISWLVDLPATTIDVTADFGAGVATFSDTIPAGQYWGFNTDATGLSLDAPAGEVSLMGALAAIVQAILQDPAKFNIPGALVAATRLWREAGGIRYLATEFNAAGVPGLVAPGITISFPGGNEEFFGEKTGGTILINNLTLLGYNEINNAGYYSPYNLTVLDTRNYQNTVYAAESISGNRTAVVSWGNEKEGRVLTFPFVYAAYVFDYRRSLAVFSNVALTDVADPNNLLQRVREAAVAGGDNFIFRVFQDNAEYSESYLIQQDRLETLDAYTDDVSGNGQLFSVTIPFRTINKIGAL
jgi:hypothetical protein